MPNYEYRCRQCRKRFSIFQTYSEYGKKLIICPHCESIDVQRRIDRIRVLQSDESRVSRLTDYDNLDGLDNDPEALGKMMRQMKGEIGEEMGPEFDEVVERLEKGQSPEDIERELPEIGNTERGLDSGLGSLGGD